MSIHQIETTLTGTNAISDLSSFDKSAILAELLREADGQYRCDINMTYEVDDNNNYELVCCAVWPADISEANTVGEWCEAITADLLGQPANK